VHRFGLVFLLVVVCSIFASAQITFTAYPYTSSFDTASTVSGDFNNDGIVDLVTIDTQTLSFYKGLGNGQFAAPVQQDITNFLGQAVAADFNRDGKLDVAAISTSSSSDITVFLGNGNGTFTQTVGATISGYAQAIATADFNGDHIPDLALSVCSTSGSPCSAEVLVGAGNGSFTQSATLSYGGGPVVAGDFNADGHQDVAMLNGSGGSWSEIAVFLGKGNGSFQNALVATISNVVALAVGDFYNNRIQSLAALSWVFNGGNPPTDFVSTVRYSNGALTVGSPQFVISGWYLDGIGAGDLNGDFLDDVVLVGGNGMCRGTCNYTPGPISLYMLGNGNGTFQSAVNAPNYGDQGERLPFVRDFNLDSRHDIGITWDEPEEEEGGGALVLINNNAATNCAPPKANALGVHVCAPASGQTVPTTFTFKAAGNAFNGTVKRMELWIDGKKMGQNLEDQLKITKTLAVGSHTASFVVVDSFDNHTTSAVPFSVN
jgi:FG-GAP-like repeat